MSALPGVRRKEIRDRSSRSAPSLADAERSVPLGGADAAAYPVLLAWEPEGTTVRDGALTLPATSAAVLGPATPA